jgi:hypothetical protein
MLESNIGLQHDRYNKLEITHNKFINNKQLIIKKLQKIKQLGGYNFEQKKDIEIENVSITSIYYKKYIELWYDILNNYPLQKYYDALNLYKLYVWFVPHDSKFYRDTGILTDKTLKNKGDGLYDYLGKKYQDISYETLVNFSTLEFWEYEQKYNFMPTKEHCDTLSIANFTFISQFYSNVYTKLGIKGDIDIINLAYLNKEHEYTNERIKQIQQLIPDFSLTNIDTLPQNLDVFNFEKKYNVIYNSVRSWRTLKSVLYYVANDHMVLIYLLISILKLKKNGTLLFRIGNILSSLRIDMLCIIKEQFKSFVIARSDLYIAEHQNGFVVICQGYNGGNKTKIEKLLKELIKADPDMGEYWSIPKSSLDTMIETEEHDYMVSKDFRYWELNYCDAEKERNAIIQTVYKLNKFYYIEAINDLNNIKKILETKKVDKKYYKKKQIYSCINWAKKYHWKLKPNLKSKAFTDKFGSKLLEELISYDKAYKGIIRQSKNNIKSNLFKESKNTDIVPKFSVLQQGIVSANRVIDTRDPIKYADIRQEVTIYRKNMHGLIAHKYNGEGVTQAWQKMWEILCSINIVNKNAKNFNSFHGCEAPGSFILSLNHYIHTKTQIKDWTWMAQSLNPTNNPDVFGDRLGLLKNFPNNWDFGPTMSGDITDYTNFIYYVKYCVKNKVDLITFDCGISQDLKSSRLPKLNYAIMLFILLATPIGKNGLFKIFIPFGNTEICFIYLLSVYFERIIFFKPLQNPRSAEFYIICSKKKKNLPKKDETYLLNVLKKYEDTRSIFNQDSIPDKFINELHTIIHQLTFRYTNAVEQKIYIYDNKHLFTDLQKNIVEMTFKKKVEDWLTKFPIKRLDSKFKLLS